MVWYDLQVSIYYTLYTVTQLPVSVYRVTAVLLPEVKGFNPITMYTIVFNR